MIFVDTNIIIDIMGNGGDWADWSVSRLARAGRDGHTVVNAIVLAELSRNFRSADELMVAIATLLLVVEPIDEEVAFLAGRSFLSYRQNRSADSAPRVLPDFFIGAHAVTLGAALLTRDAAIYRTYFPDLPLITPETDA